MEQNSEPMTADELERVHVAVQEMFLIPAQHRRLSLLRDLLGGLGKRLNRWVEGGEYGWVFDNQDDTLSLSNIQCFEFEGTDSTNKGVAEVLEPLILTIIHRVTQPLYDEAQVGRLKVFLLGELWSLLRHPAIESVTEELLRRARAKNGIVLMETQSPLEISNSRIGQVILNACATRIYMAAAIDQKYEELLQLNARKREIIRNLRKKKELFFDQPRGVSKKLELNVSEDILWLAANDPGHNERRREAMEQHGPLVSQWLPALIGSNGGSNKCVVS
jgi:type IV secretion system protein VirB4